MWACDTKARNPLTYLYVSFDVSLFLSFSPSLRLFSLPQVLNMHSKPNKWDWVVTFLCLASLIYSAYYLVQSMNGTLAWVGVNEKRARKFVAQKLLREEEEEPKIGWAAKVEGGKEEDGGGEEMDTGLGAAAKGDVAVTPCACVEAGVV